MTQSEFPQPVTPAAQIALLFEQSRRLKTYVDQQLVLDRDRLATLEPRPVKWGTSSARIALTGQADGQQWYETDTKKRYTWNGSAWIYDGGVDSPANYVPTFSNFTLGNGSIRTCVYTFDGAWVEYEGDVALGSTSSMGPVPMVSLPVNAVVTGAVLIGTARAEDSSDSSKRYVGLSEIFVGVYGQVAHFASHLVTDWASTIPFGVAWATGDNFQWHIRYRWR